MGVKLNTYSSKIIVNLTSALFFFLLTTMTCQALSTDGDFDHKTIAHTALIMEDEPQARPLTWREKIAAACLKRLPSTNWALSPTNKKRITTATKVAAIVCVTGAILTTSIHAIREAIDHPTSLHAADINLFVGGSCSGIVAHQRSIYLRTFGCMVAFNPDILTHINNLWFGNVSTAWDAGPFNTALGWRSETTCLLTMQNGTIAHVKTSVRETFCQKPDCVKVFIQKDQIPRITFPSPFTHELAKANATYHAQAAGRPMHALQATDATSNALSLMQDNVVQDNALQSLLIHIYKAFYQMQCPSLHALIDHLGNTYNAIFPYTTKAAPNVAMSLWYGLVGRKASITQGVVEFMAGIIKGNGTCDFHSNETLPNGADVQVKWTQERDMYIYVGERINDMMRPTFTREITAAQKYSPTKTKKKLSKTPLKKTPSNTHPGKKTTKTASQKISPSKTGEDTGTEDLSKSDSLPLNKTKTPTLVALTPEPPPPPTALACVCTCWGVNYRPIQFQPPLGLRCSYLTGSKLCCE